MNQKSATPDPRNLILNQLRNPLKLRFILGLSMLGAWFFFFFMPLCEQTEVTAGRIARDVKRIATAREIDQLKKSLAPYQGLVPAGANLNELMRQVIDQLRSSPLKLIDLKPGTAKDLGPYETIGLQLALEGRFNDLDAFLGWIEADARHLRVDSIKIDPNLREPGLLKAQITLLSLAEKTPAQPKAKPPSGEPRATKPTS
jgi:Tfp pilus assembly protein PilO